MKRRAALLLVVGLAGCFGATSLPKSYYVLHQHPLDFRLQSPAMPGLVYVRNLDVDAVYEKFQIVVRNSPYQLRYSDLNVWAVKPHEMISDLVAQALDHTNTFESVTRELIESRPQYTLSGQLAAAEIYDSDDLWFAHLAISLHLSRFSDGARVWSYDFDRRKEVPTRTFEHGVRALSELTQTVVEDVIDQLSELGGVRSEPDADTPSSPFDEPLPGGPSLPSEPVFVPEPPPPARVAPPEAEPPGDAAA